MAGDGFGHLVDVMMANYHLLLFLRFSMRQSSQDAVNTFKLQFFTLIVYMIYRPVMTTRPVPSRSRL